MVARAYNSIRWDVMATWRHELGLSLQGASDLLGVPASTIHHHERRDRGCCVSCTGVRTNPSYSRCGRCRLIQRRQRGIVTTPCVSCGQSRHRRSVDGRRDTRLCYDCSMDLRSLIAFKGRLEHQYPNQPATISDAIEEAIEPAQWYELPYSSSMSERLLLDDCELAFDETDPESWREGEFEAGAKSSTWISDQPKHLIF